MDKHGNRIRLTVTVSEEAGQAIARFQERFGCTASAVVEVCVLTERDSLKRIDQVLGPQGFDSVVKFLRWWSERPGPFDDWTPVMKGVK